MRVVSPQDTGCNREPNKNWLTLLLQLHRHDHCDHALMHGHLRGYVLLATRWYKVLKSNMMRVVSLGVIQVAIGNRTRIDLLFFNFIAMIVVIILCMVVFMADESHTTRQRKRLKAQDMGTSPITTSRPCQELYGRLPTRRATRD